MNTTKNRLTIGSALIVVSSLLAGCGPEMAQTPPTNPNGPAGAAAAKAAPKAPPPTVAECKTMAAKAATNAPATTATDPKKQFDDTFQAYQEPFRCCFDALYAPQSPRTDGRVALGIQVNHEGKLIGAEVVATESSIAMPEMNACMIDIAKTITYPKPATDSAVDYKRVFQFKARR